MTTATMTLANVRKGRRPAPDRILLVGTEGVGKSTFAANAPSPVFIAAEDGTRHLDVSSFPEPESLDDVYAALEVLETSEHDYQTLVIDSVDWLEPMLFRRVCADNGWENIEEPGYGKGYNVASEEWRKVLGALDRVRAKGIEVILIAHATIKLFSNPAGPDFSRYEVALSKQGSALLKQWSDSVLFACYEEFRDEKSKKTLSTGQRIVHTVRTAAWDAKCRADLPEVLPLDYEEYASARRTGQVSRAKELRNLAAALLEQLDPPAEKRNQILEFIGEGTDVRRLEQTVNRLQALIAQKGVAA